MEEFAWDSFAHGLVVRLSLILAFTYLSSAVHTILPQLLLKCASSNESSLTKGFNKTNNHLIGQFLS
jgi:hypothetical protein